MTSENVLPSLHRWQKNKLVEELHRKWYMYLLGCTASMGLAMYMQVVPLIKQLPLNIKHVINPKFPVLHLKHTGIWLKQERLFARVHISYDVEKFKKTYKKPTKDLRKPTKNVNYQILGVSNSKYCHVKTGPCQKRSPTVLKDRVWLFKTETSCFMLASKKW